MYNACRWLIVGRNERSGKPCINDLCGIHRARYAAGRGQSQSPAGNKGPNQRPSCVKKNFAAPTTRRKPFTEQNVCTRKNKDVLRQSLKALVRLCVGTDCEPVGPTRGGRAPTKGPGIAERPVKRMLARDISCTPV